MSHTPARAVGASIRKLATSSSAFVSAESDSANVPRLNASAAASRSASRDASASARASKEELGSSPGESMSKESEASVAT